MSLLLRLNKTQGAILFQRELKNALIHDLNLQAFLKIKERKNQYYTSPAEGIPESNSQCHRSIF